MAAGQGHADPRGVEVDIRADGSLDMPDDVLAGLDWVMASCTPASTGSARS